ncbi:MAG: transcriptional regulator [Acidiferrobacteraceae bacterium]|jgi:DNA-binding transcriptional ArsR family regulator|nr:transcriptional regulator [Acidiferrobacteraceae bacterium]|tara:strand:- start:57 stop:371 length:315 start_codon:yes stop_codon:yes gene_type:complete
MASLATNDLLRAHPALFDRVRLAIMAHLSLAKKAVDFTSLLTELQLTRGNLSTHMKKLEEDGLVRIDKNFVGRKPRTTYLCTNKGRKAVQTYLTAVEAVLKSSL